MERHSLERDAPQSVNLHLKEIHEPQLSANAGTRRRIVGPPEKGQKAADTNFRHWEESTVAQKYLDGRLLLLGMLWGCPSS